jgi:hypothetical protein
LTHPAHSLWLFVLLAAQLAPAGLRAQTAASNEAPKSQSVAKDTVPLGRFVAKDNLAVYVEFAGLDAHAESWSNTAASKMLNNTPLGVMLTEVTGQLVDKALEFFPDHTLNGAEIVTLVKNAARNGFVVAIHVPPNTSEPCRGTLVLRGAAGKELRPLTGRLMGWLMGDATFNREKRDARTLVIVPGKAGSAAAGTPGWAWWAEKDDLVVGFLSPSSAAGIIAAIDGKTPSAMEHPLVQELAKPEGKFQPICSAFAETANCPENPASFTAALRRLNAEWGIKRIDLRWGFDGDALVSVTRLAAPKPRKPALALVDVPALERNSLLSLPDGVESFVELSLSYTAILQTIEKLAPAGSVRETIDEFAESVHRAGSIDLRKDLLAHLGPRLALYLAPGRSATTNEDTLEAALKNGWSPSAAVAALQAVFPKLTLVAEVKQPAAFGNAIDAAMIAINDELKSQAIEVAAAQRKEEEKKDGGTAGRGAGGRSGAVGDRTKRRRSLQDTLAPRFDPRPTSGGMKIFVMTTPADSPLRFGPSSFRPTVQFDGHYVAVSVSQDAARAALAAVRQKEWKPTSDADRALENVPAKPCLLSVIDVSESLSSLLASLPGTLQTMINTSAALAKGRATANKAAGSTAQAHAGGPTAGAAGGPGGRMGRGGGMIPGAAGASGRSSRGGGLGAGGGFGPGAGSSSPTGGASAADSVVTLKVDSEKLPKATDLKGRLFASTLVASATDQEIRIVTRGAFPNLTLLVDLVPVAAVTPALEALLQRVKPAEASPTSPAPASGTATPAGGAKPGAVGSPPAAAPGGPDRPPRPGAGRRGGRP